jgi:two-component system chemotaxis sensor kinase CheA
LASAVKEENRLFLISTSFDVGSFDEEFFRLKEKLAAWGDVISTSPAVDQTRPDKINFQMLYASAGELRNLEAGLIDFPNVVLNPIANLPVEQSTELQTSSPSISASASSLANFVRIDLATLDRLISSTHELFRRTSNMLDATTDGSAAEELRQVNAEIKESFLGVEDELINLRMVSLGPTLQRAVRAGRTAARIAEKEIDFEVSGGDLRIDKLLADAIAGPLVHLIRNAVDHGIENAETRARAGKSNRGTVKISARSEGGRSRVRVTDDGRGIDPEVVSAAARRLGIVQAENNLDFAQSVRVLFRPGFTTADSVSSLSGRGVGLDVVEKSIEQAGGALRVASKPGAGTSFEIRLPVTFGLVEAMVVVSAGQRYCIAASQTLSGSEIEDAAKVPATPPVSLRELLGQPSPVTQTVSLRPEATEAPQLDNNSQPDALLIAYLLSDETDAATGRGPKSVRINVDKIERTEKVLVRGLGRHSGRWYGVAGATELSDGTVALVLDMPRLLTGLEYLSERSVPP